MLTRSHQDLPAREREKKAALDKRLEDVGWGVFFLMIGTIWLVPADRIPSGTWLIGTGLLLLGLNLIRLLNGIRIHTLAGALGVLALAAGMGSVGGVELPLFAFALIATGAVIILKGVLPRER